MYKQHKNGQTYFADFVCVTPGSQHGPHEASDGTYAIITVQSRKGHVFHNRTAFIHNTNAFGIINRIGGTRVTRDQYPAVAEFISSIKKQMEQTS